VDISHRPGREGSQTAVKVVDTRSRTTTPVRDEREPEAPGDKYRPVTCNGCGAIVALVDSECWRCYRYFGPAEFDDQR
jgi:hypothetical protein